MAEKKTPSPEILQEYVYHIAEAQDIVVRYSQLVAIRRDSAEDNDLRAHFLFVLAGLQDIKEHFTTLLDER